MSRSIATFALLLAAGATLGCLANESDVAEYEWAVWARAVTARCIEGYRWNDRARQCTPDRGDHECDLLGPCTPGFHCDEHVCGCLPDGRRGGEACGKRGCGAPQVCCNPSCGICTPTNGSRFQLACQ